MNYTSFQVRLGSLTGLYEVAVDLLCEQDGGQGQKLLHQQPRYEEQMNKLKALYGREVVQFPLAVRKADDNFVSYSLIQQKKARSLISWYLCTRCQW